MTINFPSNPSVSQIYTESGYSYEFTGSKWKPTQLGYTVTKSDISVTENFPVNNLIIDFDNNVQYLTANSGASVEFANAPDIGEYKRVIIDANFTPDYLDVNSLSFGYPSGFSYDNVSSPTFDYDVSDIEFSSDGTRLFAADATNNRVVKYDLSSAWDISSIGPSSETLSLPVLDTPIAAVQSSTGAFRTDTTSVYSYTASSVGSASVKAGDLVLLVILSGYDIPPTYTMSPPWTLIRYSAYNTTYSGVAAMFYTIITQDGVLPTPTYTQNRYRVSTTTYTRMYRLTGVSTSNPIAGSTGATGTDSSVEITRPAGDYHFGAIAYGHSNNVSPYWGSLWVSASKGDFTSYTWRLLWAEGPILSWETQTIVYAYGTNTNESYASIVVGFNQAVKGIKITAVQLIDDTNLFVTASSSSTHTIKNYTLPAINTLTGATLSKNKSPGTGAFLDSYIEPASGNSVFVATGSEIQEYSLSIAYDIESAWTLVDSYTTSVNEDSITFDDIGSKMYVAGGGSVSYSELSTPWDLTTATEIETITLSDSTNIDAITFKSIGGSFFALDYANTTSSSIDQYATTDADPTIIWPSSIKWENAAAPLLPAAGENIIIEIEARTDSYGTNYTARELGRNY